jgi:pyrroline-5-carboxylate reductase
LELERFSPAGVESVDTLGRAAYFERMPTSTRKIAFLGTGKLNQALLRGLRLRPHAYKLAASVRSPESRARLEAAFEGLSVTLDNRELVQGASYVILGVKPYAALEVVQALKDSLPQGTTLVSLCARLPLARLREILSTRPDVKLVRLMPNTACEVGAGLLGVSCENESLLEPELLEVFSRLGQVRVIPERDMDVFTILGACTPAFFLRMAEALERQALSEGFEAAFVRQALGQVLVGAGHLLQSAELSARERIQQIATPGGVTAEGLSRLDKFQIDAAAVQAFESALAKCQSLKL